MAKFKIEEPYRVVSHTFKGYTEEGELYTYEITFNKSLVHTGRMKGIEDGLSRYVKREVRNDVLNSFREVYYSLIRWFRS